MPKTHGTSSKMGNLLAGMLEADPDFKKVVSRYMNRAGFDTTTVSLHTHLLRGTQAADARDKTRTVYSYS